MRAALTVFCLSMVFTSFAHADTPMTGSFKEAYVPMGFDSNDRSQITVEGAFDDSCYRVDDPLVQVDEAAKTIRLEMHGLKVNGYCFVLPGTFVQTINLGQLSDGVYSITNMDGTKTYDSLNVAAAKIQTQDDYPYASVTQAYVRGTTKNKKVVLQVSLNPSCQAMKEIKVTVQNKVIAVQPILEVKSSACTGSPVATEVSKPLPTGLTGHFLLHVRSTAGTALNNMVDL